MGAVYPAWSRTCFLGVGPVLYGSCTSQNGSLGSRLSIDRDLSDVRIAFMGLACAKSSYTSPPPGTSRGAGGWYLFDACLTAVIRPLTAHPFQDGTPLLLLLIETPPAFGRSLRFFHMLHTGRFIKYRTFCLSHSLPVSPCVATIYILGWRSFFR